jgi:hypothetical protein
VVAFEENNQERQTLMKAYSVLYAQDVSHYAPTEICASSDAEAIEKARTNPEIVHIPFEDPDWNNPVCLRIVHVEDAAGNLIAHDIPLDDYRLQSSQGTPFYDDILNALRGLREAVKALPITIMSGSFYDTLHAVDRALEKAGVA